MIGIQFNSYFLKDDVLMQLFLHLLERNPKPQKMSKTIYRVCLAIQILEMIGNKFPQQIEIDSIELMLRRFSNRKLARSAFNNACEIAVNVDEVA
ncbi:MAG TPA: hypothetical protein VG895_00090 [Patescibacteria group bacterium]|nr:hypothetical protein [Gammaproteobacteria bacterium]HWA51441.1 hypothetical protein [Patescibacteria group bacterium]